MTSEQVAALSDREIARITAKMMGWVEVEGWWEIESPKSLYGYKMRPVAEWDPCQDPRDAAIVEEWLVRQGWYWEQRVIAVNFGVGVVWEGAFTRKDKPIQPVEFQAIRERPRKLCEAAVLVKGE